MNNRKAKLSVKEGSALLSSFSQQKAAAKEKPLDPEVYNIVIGVLLGHSWIKKSKSSAAICIQMWENDPHYCNYIHNKFFENNYCASKKPYILRYTRLSINQSNKSAHLPWGSKGFFANLLRTYSFDFFNQHHELFYKDNQKVVPPEIRKYLNAQVLSAWIMDSGSRLDRETLLYTEFTKLQDIESLQDALSFNFGLKLIVKEESPEYFLYLSKDQLAHLQTIVKPFILPSMYYKIHG